MNAKAFMYLVYNDLLPNLSLVAFVIRIKFEQIKKPCNMLEVGFLPLTGRLFSSSKL